MEASYLVSAAVNRARTERGPVLIRLSVPRLCCHSGADSQSYKSAEEREDEQRRDPLPRLREHCLRIGAMTEEEWDALAAEVETKVRTACDRAVAQPEPSPDTVFDHVVFDGTHVQSVGGQFA
ncbi:MAG: thiamine pyrophosphate-dependent enzyme [Candidatus Kapaibacterium sp.]